MTVPNDSFHFTRESDFLHVRALTRFILEQKEAAAQAIAAAIAARPTKAALIDLRDVPGPYTFMDRVQLGEVAGKYLAGTPIAAVLTGEQVDPERIGRLVARNRGANVEVFLDPVEARAWVKKYLAPQTSVSAPATCHPRS